MHHIIISGIALLLASLAGACASGTKSPVSTSSDSVTAKADAPLFSPDSAFSYIRSQVEMGPRVPGSEPHRICGQWIISELNRHNADTVVEQKAVVVNPNDGSPLPILNILGRFNPDATERILLVAHYDTRPFADEETDKSKQSTPIPGANDGGSGVAVLLEIARLMGMQKPDRGVDLLFVDAEDMGISSENGNNDTENTWCLGSQYWAENMPYSAADKPDMGIVVDMVGGTNARFHRELFSDHYAPALVDKVWQIAASLGYGARFINAPGGPILDDHLPILKAGIPTIDIVESRSDATGAFPATWHTLNDNLDHIDRGALEATGRTVTSLIYLPALIK